MAAIFPGDIEAAGVRSPEQPGLGRRRKGKGDMAKKRLNKPQRVQADKNYIEVMGKIFAVLEFFIERGSFSLSTGECAHTRPMRKRTINE